MKGFEAAAMARIIKTAAERKKELIDCAETLFLRKGYEATTVADILAQTGLSKGAFYHHFESKEDLLDALTERVGAAIIAAAQDILQDDSLDALTRLNRFLARSGQFKRETASELNAVFSAVFQPENAVLYQRMMKAGIRAVMPVLTRIVEQGVREGLFRVPDAEIVAEMLLHLGTARQALVVESFRRAAQGDLDVAVEALERRLSVEQTIIDRILGLPEGSVVLFQPGFMREMLAVYAARMAGARDAA